MVWLLTHNPHWPFLAAAFVALWILTRSVITLRSKTAQAQKRPPYSAPMNPQEHTSWPVRYSPVVWRKYHDWEVTSTFTLSLIPFDSCLQLPDKIQLVLLKFLVCTLYILHSRFTLWQYFCSSYLTGIFLIYNNQQNINIFLIFNSLAASINIPR